MTSKAVWGSWAEIHPDTAQDARRRGRRSAQDRDRRRQRRGARVSLRRHPQGRGRDRARPGPHRVRPLRARTAASTRSRCCRRRTDARLGRARLPGREGQARRAARKAMDLLPAAGREGPARPRTSRRSIPVAALLGAAASSRRASRTATSPSPGAHENDFGGHYPAGEGALYQDAVHVASPASTPSRWRAPIGYKTPAHAITAFEPELQGARAARRTRSTSGSYDSNRAQHRWAMAIDLDSLHRLRRVRGGVLRREQHPGRRPGPDQEGPRDVVDPHRALRGAAGARQDSTCASCR